MNFSVFLDCHEALVMCGGDSIVSGYPGPPKQQMIQGMSINDMKMCSYLHRSNSQVKIDVTESKRRIASNA